MSWPFDEHGQIEYGLLRELDANSKAALPEWISINVTSIVGGEKISTNEIVNTVAYMEDDIFRQYIDNQLRARIANAIARKFSPKFTYWEFGT